MGILSSIKKFFAPFSDPDLNAVNSALIKTIDKYVPKEKYDEVYGNFRGNVLSAWERVEKRRLEAYEGEVPEGKIEGFLKKSNFLFSPAFAEFVGYAMATLKSRPENVLKQWKLFIAWILALKKREEYNEFYKVLRNGFLGWAEYVKAHPELKGGKEKEFELLISAL